MSIFNCDLLTVFSAAAAGIAAWGRHGGNDSGSGDGVGDGVVTRLKLFELWIFKVVGWT